MWEPEEGNSSEYHVTFVDTIMDMEAWVKKDGCFELISYYNGGTESGQIHFCNLDLLLPHLQDSTAKPPNYFDGDSPP